MDNVRSCDASAQLTVSNVGIVAPDDDEYDEFYERHENVENAKCDRETLELGEADRGAVPLKQAASE